MNPYEFKYKVDGQQFANFYASKLIQEERIHAVKHLLKSYLTYPKKDIKKFLSQPNTKQYEELLPFLVCGEPSIKTAEDLIVAALDILNSNYDLPEDYVDTMISIAKIEPFAEGEKVIVPFPFEVEIYDGKMQ